jgi:hypothetical protein
MGKLEPRTWPKVRMHETVHILYITENPVCHTLALGRNFSVLQLNYRARICKRLRSPDPPAFVAGPVQQIGLSYLPARLHMLAESMPWNRFLNTLNVFNFGLRVRPCKSWVWFASFRQVILVTSLAGGLGTHIIGSWVLHPPLYRVARVLPNFSQGDYRDLWVLLHYRRHDMI